MLYYFSSYYVDRDVAVLHYPSESFHGQKSFREQRNGHIARWIQSWYKRIQRKIGVAFAFVFSYFLWYFYYVFFYSEQLSNLCSNMVFASTAYGYGKPMFDNFGT